MKVAVISLVLFGVIAAICAAVLIATLARPAGSSAPLALKAEQDVDVLVAARELQPMSVVGSDAVVIKKVPKSQVPPNALLNPVQVVGKVLTDRMLADQAFTKSCFAREGTGVYLATAVPQGKRAMSITLADWSGMAGLLYPGSLVDVLVSFKTLGNDRGGRTDNELLSTTLLQGLQVLAIGSQSIAADEYQDKEAGALAQRGQVNTRMVTLLVDPKQAEILQLAMQAGSVSLAMRNPLDGEHEARRLTRAREISPNGGAASVVTASDADPFGDATEPAPVAAGNSMKKANEWETIIIRGNDASTRTFPLPGEPTDDDGAAPGAGVTPATSTPPVASPAATEDPAASADEPVEVGAS